MQETHLYQCQRTVPLTIKDHRRLNEDAYATNLKLYLDYVVLIADVTMDDLDRAINIFTQHD